MNADLGQIRDALDGKTTLMQDHLEEPGFWQPFQEGETKECCGKMKPQKR